MKKNKKFQKELLAKDGYEEIRGIFSQIRVVHQKGNVKKWQNQ